MKAFFLVIVSAVLTLPALSQKQLAILKNGHVVASFKEGEYLRYVLRKGHKHVEGHIIELDNFSMITSYDTVKFKDILKIDIRKHRGGPQWNSGVGGTLFLGGILFLGIGQLNAAIGIHSSSLSDQQLYIPLAISAVGAAMVFIRPRYKRINGIQYLQTIDYTSPFYQH